MRRTLLDKFVYQIIYFISSAPSCLHLPPSTLSLVPPSFLLTHGLRILLDKLVYYIIYLYPLLPPASICLLPPSLPPASISLLSPYPWLEDSSRQVCVLNNLLYILVTCHTSCHPCQGLDWVREERGAEEKREREEREKRGTEEEREREREGQRKRGREARERREGHRKRGREGERERGEREKRGKGREEGARRREGRRARSTTNGDSLFQHFQNFRNSDSVVHVRFRIRDQARSGVFQNFHFRRREKNSVTHDGLRSEDTLVKQPGEVRE
jgi:hypothetical protein